MPKKADTKAVVVGQGRPGNRKGIPTMKWTLDKDRALIEYLRCHKKGSVSQYAGLVAEGLKKMELFTDCRDLLKSSIVHYRVCYLRKNFPSLHIPRTREVFQTKNTVYIPTYRDLIAKKVVAK